MEKQFMNPLAHIVERMVANHLFFNLKDAEMIFATVSEAKEKLPQSDWKYILFFLIQKISEFPPSTPLNVRLNFVLQFKKLFELNAEGVFPEDEIHEASLDRKHGRERLARVVFTVSQSLF